MQGTTPARAAAIVRRAEESRARFFREILGADTPAGWSVPCEIHLHDSEAAFADAVGGPPDDARGATSIEFAGDEVVFRRIDLMDDDRDGMPAALAHELVHVVLAERFTAAPPPRWADEGLAVLHDDPATQAAHEQDFQEARRTGMTWSASHLLSMEEYPREPQRQRIFYGQSAALVRWLIERRDTATFLEFLEDASSDQAAALERHYELPSAAALERAWLERPAVTDVGAE